MLCCCGGSHRLRSDQDTAVKEQDQDQDQDQVPVPREMT